MASIPSGYLSYFDYSAHRTLGEFLELFLSLRSALLALPR